jgi:arsenite methyltransferase
MQSADEIKLAVQARYAAWAAGQPLEPATAEADWTAGFSPTADAYDGWLLEAASGPCGMVIDHLELSPGQTVLDLGSGTGRESVQAARRVGPAGRVIGIDLTPAMVQRADTLARQLGMDHVEFRRGDAEQLDLPDQSVDVILCNGLLGLVPDKPRALAEMFRVLRPGGQLGLSDLVFVGNLPGALQTSLERGLGLLAGALQLETYVVLLRQAGFADLTVKSLKPLPLADRLSQLPQLAVSDAAALEESGAGIFCVCMTAVKLRQPKPAAVYP